MEAQSPSLIESPLVSPSVEPETETMDNAARITVLSKGFTIDYSFPVHEAKLVEVKLCWRNSCGELEVFDCFARDCENLDHALPVDIIVPYSYKNAFAIEVRQIMQNSTIHYIL